MEHRHDKYWEHKGYKIIECMDCGFKHVYPVPEKESMKSSGKMSIGKLEKDL